MPKYKLIYFDTKAWGEGIRLILSYMAADWEDVRIIRPKFPASTWWKLKQEVKYGKLPVLEIDGKRVYQSSAICRYLASEAGLLGGNPWENLQIDIIAGTFKDFVVELQAALRQTDETVGAEMMNVLREQSLPYYLKIYEDTLQENGGYLANGKLSWVDFYVIGFIETLETRLEETIFNKYPLLKKLKNEIFSIPNVTKWVDKRPESI